jgi:molybdopterin converting factor small subunit
MKVTVQLFARARDLAGADTVAVDLRSEATTADLRRRLAEQLPALKVLLDRCAIAIGGEFAEDGQRVPGDAEIALLPPVSGG